MFLGAGERTRTRSGYQFVENACFVSLVGMPAADIDAAEREYVYEVFARRQGWRATEVVYRGRKLLNIDGVLIDRLTIERGATGERHEINFDVSAVFPRAPWHLPAAAPIRSWNALKSVLLTSTAMILCFVFYWLAHK